MTPRHVPLLAALLLALATPAATAAPPEVPTPELPRVYECSQFQVDWYHCDHLVCLGVWYGRVAVYECVPAVACADVSCETCLPECVAPGCPTLRDCLACQPGGCIVDECSQFQIDWDHCDYLVCVSVDFGRVDETRCVDSPCPDLSQCFTCQVGNCLPYVYECSEFQVDWNYCAGMLVCVGVGHPWIGGPAPLCVRNPCSPGLTACFADCHVDVCTVPAHSCDETISNNYGWVDCDGRRVVDWYCVSMCAPTVGPVFCHQDTAGRVECHAGSSPLA